MLPHDVLMCSVGGADGGIRNHTERGQNPLPTANWATPADMLFLYNK